MKGKLTLKALEEAYKKAIRATETRIDRTIHIGKLYIHIVLFKYDK